MTENIVVSAIVSPAVTGTPLLSQRSSVRRVHIMKLRPGKPALAGKDAERGIKRAITKISEQKKHRPGREEAEREVDDDLSEAGIEQHAKDVAQAIDKNY